MRPTALPTTPPTGVPSLTPSSQPTCRPSEQPSSQPSSPPSNQPTAQPTRQPSSAPTLRLLAATAQPTVSSVPSMAPTARPSIGSAQAVNTATQDALRSLVANGTASSGTVTSVTADGLKLALAVVRPSNATHNGTTASYAVALPDSSTTVALALPSSLSGGAVAVVVTTVEVDASRFSSFGSSGGNGSSNSSATRPTVALPSPQLVSSVVSIQVSQLSSNGSLTATTVPYFETSVSVVRSNSSSGGGGGGSSKPTVLAHNCTVGVVETVSVYCADTAVRLNLTCSGRAAATVRRQCPVSQAVCSVVDLADNRIVSNSFCRTVDLGSSVVCQCGGSGVNGSAIASAGRVSVGVFQVYGAGSLTSSVALASALSASDLASRSALMFASFGCIWGVGLLLLALSWRRMAIDRRGKVQEESSSALDASAVVSRTLPVVMPHYHRVKEQDGWWRGRWVAVLMASHPYLRLGRRLVRAVAWPLLATPEEASDEDAREGVLDVLQSLTALTMACWMLALLYDFQYPEDDGFCAAQTTQATCESRKMLLDPFESQCLWRPLSTEASVAAVVQQIVKGRVVDVASIRPSAEDAAAVSCRFNGSNDSELAFIVSYVITAVFAGVLGLFLDRCMDMLKAREAKTTLGSGAKASDVSQPRRSREEAQRYSDAVEALTVREYPTATLRGLRGQRRRQPMGLGARAHHRRHAVVDQSAVQSDTDAVGLPSTSTRDPEAAGADVAMESTSRPVEAQAVTQALRSMSSTDYAVTMLRLAVADEVGRLGGPAERHVCLLGLYRAFPAVVTLRRVWLWQCAVVGVLLVCNGGALYYIVSKAAVRGFGWQVSFLKIALFEWFSEVVLLRSVEIALFDYGLCWLVEGEVEAAMAQVAAAAASLAAAGVGVDDAVWSVSQEMARQWPGLPESRWVAGLCSLPPPAVVRGDRRGHRRWWTRLLSRGSLETWEMAVSFGCPLVLAWLVFMYYRFVDGWLTSLS
eukprot:gene15689-17605_t